MPGRHERRSRGRQPSHRAPPTSSVHDCCGTPGHHSRELRPPWPSIAARHEVRPPGVTVPAREAVRPSHLLCALEEEAVVFFVAVVPYGMGPTWK